MKIKTQKTIAKVNVAVPVAQAKTVIATVKKTAPKTQRVTFSVRAEAGSKVFLAGSFNDWNLTAKELTDKKNDGVYAVTLTLVPGDYQYKFVIDGTWCADPECADWVQNDLGTLNSVKHVS